MGRVLRAARAPAVDHPGVHPATGTAFLHMGSTRHHVAPGTGGQPHGHRGGDCRGPLRLAGPPGLPLAQIPRQSPSGARGGGVQRPGNPPATPQQNWACPFLQTGMVPPALPDRGWNWDPEEAQPLPERWIPPLWYLPTDTLAHASHPVKGALLPPQPPGAALFRSLQAGAAWVWWQENGRPGPYCPLVHGQALLHAQDMGTLEWGAIVPDTACKWITAAALQPMRSPPAFAVSPVNPPFSCSDWVQGHSSVHKVQWFWG